MRSDDQRRTIKELGFFTWLREVLWYHYRWLIMALAFISIALVYFIGTSAGRTKPDMTAIFCISDGLYADVTTAENANEMSMRAAFAQEYIRAALAQGAGDVNGDGELLINLDLLGITASGGTPMSGAEVNAKKMINSFVDRSIILYIFDEPARKVYGSDPDRFSCWPVMQLTGLDQNYITLEHSPLFAELELDGSYYAIMFKTPTFLSGDIALDEYYETAINAARALLGE